MQKMKRKCVKSDKHPTRVWYGRGVREGIQPLAKAKWHVRMYTCTIPHMRAYMYAHVYILHFCVYNPTSIHARTCIYMCPCACTTPHMHVHVLFTCRVYLVGHSRGGKISVLAALEDPRVVALCLLDPVSVLPTKEAVCISACQLPSCAGRPRRGWPCACLTR